MFVWILGYIFASAILVLMHTATVLSDTGTSSCTSLPESQYDALKDLYYSTNGLLWCLNPHTQQKWSFLPNQMTAAPCIEGWAGISCDCQIKTYQVTSLTMNGFCMRGSIPASIGNIANLAYRDNSNILNY
jgi:hypothetical protein